MKNNILITISSVLMIYPSVFSQSVKTVLPAHSKSIIAKSPAQQLPGMKSKTAAVFLKQKAAAVNQQPVQLKTTGNMVASSAPAAKTSSWCFADKVTGNYIQQQMSVDPLYPVKMNNMANVLQQWIANNPNYLQQKAVKTIPVVVHVIYNTTQPNENVSDALIYNMISTLNKDYRRLNADTSQTRSIFKPVAADVQIEFCLAQRDPSNVATNGIVRKQTTKTWWNPDTETDDMKQNSTGGDDAWNPFNYLNIWICDIDNDAGYGTAGYAYLPTPGMHGSWRDGLVIDNDIGICSGCRTATHEIGHYLGLKHTWGNNPPSCSNDDGYTDTPTSADENFGCNYSQNTCNDGAGDKVDQIENYMSYADCQNMFTTQQSNAMNATLNTTRSSLLSSQACQPTAPPVAAFIADKTTVTAGQYVNFTDQTTGGPTSWSWSFGGGGNPNTSAAQNPVIQFSTIGMYTVTLTATNSLGSDPETKTNYINVIADTTNCDTLLWPFPGTGPYYYPVDWNAVSDSGYFFGKNAYNMAPWAERFKPVQYSPNTHITGLRSAFAISYDASPYTAKLVFTIWDDNGAMGTPNTVLGTDTFTLAYLDTFINYYIESSFIPPVAVSGNIFVGFQLVNAGTGDTLAGLANGTGEAADTNAWTKYTGTWYYLTQLFGPGNAADLFVVPYFTDAPVSASFTSTTTTGCGTLTATFDASASQNADAYYWDVDGDDTLDYVTYTPTISIQYSTPATYNITLWVEGPCGGLDSMKKSNFVKIYSVPSLTASSTTTSCSSCNGTASVSVSSGTAPYTYLWNDPAPQQTTTNATGLCAGSYQVLVTDNKGCTANSGVSVNNTAAMSLNIATNDATCGQNNGTATATVTGGTAPLTYLWSNAQSSSAATGLAANTYNVTVTDAGGCTVKTDFFSAAVVSSVPYISGATTSGTNLTCSGGGNGSVSVSASTGITPYTYTWNTSCSASACSNLAAGTYNVTVADNNGCTATASQTITEPSAISASASTTSNVTCYGGSNGAASVTAAGGVGSLTYTWSSGSTISNATGLAANTYTVTVKDANGCSKTASTSVTQPNQITVATSATNASCGSSNGTATATASGGTGTLTYNWSAGGQTTSTATGLAASVYTVTVSDANSCTVAQSATVGNNGGPSVAVASQNNVSCNGGSNGSAAISATGGSGSYTYSWSGGQTTSSVTGLLAGTFTVTVTDAASCSAVTSVNITEPNVLTAPVSVTNISCYGLCNGSASIAASGGTPQYNYYWSNGQSSNPATGLCSNTYTVTVQDANGCTTTSSGTITQPTAVSVTVDTTNATCSTCANGSASATVSGGTPNYNYSWSGGGTTSSKFGLTPGSYNVTVTDANGCSVVNSFVISYPVAVTTAEPEYAIIIYPNPATGVFNVKTSGIHVNKITVTNVIGKTVFVKGLNNGAEQFPIDISEQQNGMYFVQINTDVGTIVKRITLVR